LRCCRKAGQEELSCSPQLTFNNIFPELTFAGGVLGHCAVGKDKTCNSGRRKVMDIVLNPSKNGVSFRRDSEFPAGVFSQEFSFPVGIVERRV
jgi:hypothetical protein